VSQEKLAAERKWFAIAPDGSQKEVLLRVGVPITNAKGTWLAEASIDGLDHRSYPIAGVDAWQATSLAMKFLVSRVEHYVDMGWKFYWEQNGKEASSNHL
jgi:hypothetical protein